jgi:hypothetical protein
MHLRLARLLTQRVSCSGVRVHGLRDCHVPHLGASPDECTVPCDAQSHPARHQPHNRHRSRHRGAGDPCPYVSLFLQSSGRPLISSRSDDVLCAAYHKQCVFVTTAALCVDANTRAVCITFGFCIGRACTLTVLYNLNTRKEPATASTQAISYGDSFQLSTNRAPSAPVRAFYSGLLA